jgi:nicotinate-nucleotide pyrophosphorylase (carboxylating)
MHRKTLAEFTHKVEAGLNLDSENYKQWVFRYTFLELEKDLGTGGDITTKAVFRGHKVVSAQVVAKDGGVFAGREELNYFLVDAHPNFRPSLRGDFHLDFKFKDGEQFTAGDVLLEIRADVSDLLAVERVLLNLLGRMCSVASYARQVVDLVDGQEVLICSTRKTLWGMLDKKAVLLGGGATHRLNLSDAVMVKDNHFDLFDRDIEQVVQRIADADVQCRFVEFEVDTMGEILAICKAFKAHEKEIEAIPVILLDNFDPSEIVKGLKSVKEAGYYDDFLFEASGGINEENVLDYAKTGVDIISMGCLTQGVPGVDLGLEIVSR